ncbi:class I SAM-dependent methyltransferase [Streptomyces sp. ME02-8801-2C]|uniref:class I SAM-dependent methyltransferase n=1 Tax=Streptomyces sp. ME02-8801-2C TaxID=3028680 RepID=UPI0029A82787|nr:class I SAM-dependent methyltransferase [Streptomyces sp. ME02-8801-2C]MDX3453424.1 class I SAM-dependent methyltransferase [Streptomyces sp. ME02-8801-2C]
MDTSQDRYELGSAPPELERLTRQGRVLEPATRTLLRAAGVGAGMRVLDLGSGAGDVSFLAAELVGPTGEVIGLDQSPDAVELATTRARHNRIDNVRFVVGDIHEPAPGGPFDAIIGRVVLLYSKDPAAVLRTQARQLRPGGVVAPIETDLTTAGARPATPLASRLVSWAGAGFAAANANPTLGRELWEVLREAGLRPLGMLGVQPHFGPGDPNGPALYAGMIRTMVPLLERTGAATAQEIDPDTLEERLAQELIDADAALAYAQLLCAWGTKD